jgi:1-acyl-sn-glycerol-3-phosphate acyltransferase
MPQQRPDNHMRLYWHFWRITARWIYVTAFRGRVLGAKNVPREGGVLLVSTHQSYIDPVLASLAFDRETDFMARESLFYYPRFAKLISSLNAFPVRRNTADLRAIKETLRRLKSGKMVLVFPEGTRSPDGRIGELQPGVAAIAKQAEVTVVPTLIEGAYNVWPKQSRWPRPARIIVRYAPAIPPEQVAAMGKHELIARIDRTLREMQAEVRRIYGFPPLPGNKEYEARAKRPPAPDFGRGWHFGFVASRLMLPVGSRNKAGERRFRRGQSWPADPALAKGNDDRTSE